MFDPNDNGLVYSAGEKDGIFIWNFYGDVKSQYGYSAVTKSQMQESRGEDKQMSLLDKMRTSRKESKQLAAAKALAMAKDDCAFVVN